MKFLIFLPFAVLFGILLGGWSPKEELRALRQELDALRQKADSRQKDTRFDAITRMVQIPERAAAKPKAKPAHAERSVTVDLDAPTSTVAQAVADTPIKTGASGTPPLEANESQQDVSPEDIKARIEEAKALWATRVQIARSQWLNRLKLTAENTERFDASINAMNEELQASMQGLADVLALGEEMTPELGTRFFNEMTTSLVRTYDDLTVIVPEEQRGEAAKLELTDFIDPAVAEPLIAVQDKLDTMPGPGGRRFPRGRR